MEDGLPGKSPCGGHAVECSGEPGVMKQELLGIPACGAEVGAGEIPQGFGFDVRISGEIELPKDPFHPDIDGESGEPLPAKKQGAVGDLFPNSVELAERGPGGFVRKLGDARKVKVAFRNVAGGTVEECGAVTQTAGAEGGLPGLREGLRSGIGPLRREFRGGGRMAKTFP